MSKEGQERYYDLLDSKEFKKTDAEDKLLEALTKEMLTKDRSFELMEEDRAGTPSRLKWERDVLKFEPPLVKTLLDEATGVEISETL